MRVVFCMSKTEMLGDWGFPDEALAIVARERDEGLRFHPGEKMIWAQLARDMWLERFPLGVRVKRHVEKADELMVVDAFNPQAIKIGYFEEKLVQAQQRLVRDGDPVLIRRMMQSEADYLAMRRLIKRMGISDRRIVVATAFSPAERQDRYVDYKGEKMDPLLEDYFRDWAGVGVEGYIKVDGHSPNSLWYAMQEGVSVLDLSVVPKLAEVGLEAAGWDEKDEREIMVVNPDDGSLEMGMLLIESVAYLTGKGIGEIGWIPGIKKKNAKVHVAFGNQVSEVQGKLVLWLDDILGRGRTAKAGIEQLFEYNPSAVVGLISHGIIEKGAVKMINDDLPQVKWVMSDSRLPQDQDEISNLTRVDVWSSIDGVVELLNQGKLNPWSYAGRMRLYEATGLVLAPWQIYDLSRLKTGGWQMGIFGENCG